MTSREKGLAGMAENVRAGFRAGGVAPYGYNLERVATGAVRDGARAAWFRTPTRRRLPPTSRPGRAAFPGAKRRATRDFV